MALCRLGLEHSLTSVRRLCVHHGLLMLSRQPKGKYMHSSAKRLLDSLNEQRMVVLRLSGHCPKDIS